MELVIGIVAMAAGIALVILAVFRALGHSWTLGGYEMWALPGAGVLLILLGRWLVA